MKTMSAFLLLFAIVSTSCMLEGALPEEGDIVDEEYLDDTSQELTNTKVIQNCSAVGSSEATCAAYCPAGYLATGGGCRADHVHWELRANHPTSQGEGWHCTASEDFKTQVYWQGVTGWVVCMQM